MSDVKAVKRKLRDLVPDNRNANKGNVRGLAMLDDSIHEDGIGRGILLDRNNRIVAGNKTVERLVDQGFEDVLIVPTDGKTLVATQRVDVDLDTPQGRRMAIRDNRVAQVDLEFDPEVLAQLASEGLDLTLFWDDAELAALLADVAGEPAMPDPGPDIDKAEELQAKWQVKLGDLFEVGRHRLLCGDSAKLVDVQRLMNNAEADFMWTDPPYGVEYVGKTEDALTIANDGAANLPELLRVAFTHADFVLKDGAPIYIAHPAGALSVVFGQAFVAAGWRFHETLVWVKDSMVLGHSDYHYRHEPIIYGWKGINRKWYAGRDQTTVFEVDRPKRSETHPTMKPTELITAHLQNSSRRNDIGYEPFNGSGSTMVACEQTGRRCFAIEIEPKYVAVTLERLAAMGLQPQRERA